MRAIITNKIILLLSCLFIFVFYPKEILAAVKISDNLPLYGSAKYGKDFQHFEYASPNAVKGGKIVFPAYGTFDNFNPYIFKGTASGEAAGLITDTLGVVPADDISTVYPLIAEKFEIFDDNSAVGFILNPQAKFADGTPITADDVIYSFQALTQQGSPLYKIYYADVDRAEKINDRHIRFYFKKGALNKELPLILAQLPIFSAQYWKGKDFSKPELKPQLSSGPYLIDKFEPGKFISLKRNKDYWAKDLPTRKGFYNFDEIRLDYYQDTTVSLQALFSGNIDIREEYIAKIWATGYGNDLVKSGKIIKNEIAHNRAATLQSFAFNIRKEKFKDPKVRQAISEAFNFEWANEKLFHNQYNRIYSYFTNTGMEAVGKPSEKEKALLEPYRGSLSANIFDEVPLPPVFSEQENTREHLKKAVRLLNEAGYDFVDGKMTHIESGKPLEFEVLSNTANGTTFTRVMLPFIKNLEKIGIKASFRNVEVNVFKNRLDNFDFDMAIVSFPISQMPGNEQKEMWGSTSADVKGSYNLIGIKNPVVDALLEKVVQAHKKDDYIAAVKALDRVLRHEYYLIPQWYSSAQRVAYRDKFNYPQTNLKVGFQPHTWFIKEKKQ